MAKGNCYSLKETLRHQLNEAWLDDEWRKQR